jgi:cobalamin biosynthesis Mg chelatase CobN
MTNADEVLNASDEDITQEDVDAATNALANAIAALQLRPSDAVNGGPDRTTSGVTDVTDNTNDATSGDASAGKTKTDDKAKAKTDNKTKTDKSTKSGSKSKTSATTGTSSGGASVSNGGAAANNAAADSAAANDAATTVEEPAIVADGAPELASPTITGGDEGPAVIADEGAPTTAPKDASGAPTGWQIAVIFLAAAVCCLLWLLYATRKKEKDAA